MKGDIKSNFSITEHIALGTYASGANNGAAVDMADGLSATFICQMVTDGTTGTIAYKLQHSPDDSTWTDEVAGAGNSTTISLTDDGAFGLLHVVNPRDRYYRVVGTSDVADATGGVMAILGPLTSVAPA